LNLPWISSQLDRESFRFFVILFQVQFPTGLPLDWPDSPSCERPAAKTFSFFLVIFRASSPRHPLNATLYLAFFPTLASNDQLPLSCGTPGTNSLTGFPPHRPLSWSVHTLTSFFVSGPTSPATPVAVTEWTPGIGGYYCQPRSSGLPAISAHRICPCTRGDHWQDPMRTCRRGQVN